MSEAAAVPIAVLAALGAACTFGVGAALQHRQVQRERGRSPLQLLSQLARRRLWLAGIGLAVAAYGLQAVALAFGPLALVAPIVATDRPGARRPPDRTGQLHVAVPAQVPVTCRPAQQRTPVRASSGLDHVFEYWSCPRHNLQSGCTYRWSAACIIPGGRGQSA